MEGYIQLHRQLLESKVFANPITLKIWVWLLLKAAWKDRFVNLQIGKGFTTVSIKRGQLIFGRNKASDVLDIDANNVYRQLQAMQADNMILIEPNNQYSIITICNYDSYQELKGENEQQVNNQRTADEQPTNNQRTAVSYTHLTLPTILRV